MCNTPTYCDLGKAAKDVFNKGYGFGMVKIDLRTKSCSGVEFSTSGHAYTDTGKASGNLETKYKVCDYGLTFTQKWNTDNTLGTEVSWENKAKVNNASLIGLGYTQTLRAGVKLTLSALIDGKNFNAGGHKVGLGFELEA
ncbi:Voltage-dependent anion-selective channel protein 3 [Cricetulus griseus]|uniref:Non-selective voltage-gated ion channel VDAC3 n=1 Tax=Cricetulus griseus TaxID=10029 RepID=G3HHH5_CRIGR|nr:Voltage-dependent anion-selective channel protein 3 [Cricetulus griseus]ERE92488.1 voltage-dependent anion-selective channel protein 3-like isoform 1 [Cricetulus griseus]